MVENPAVMSWWCLRLMSILQWAVLFPMPLPLKYKNKLFPPNPLDVNESHKA